MHPYQQIVFRHWPGVQEALTGIRSGDLAGDELFERFNAFSDNDHAQLTPKLSHCLDDRQGSPISRQEFDEGTINLEPVDQECLSGWPDWKSRFRNHQSPTRRPARVRYVNWSAPSAKYP